LVGGHLLDHDGFEEHIHLMMLDIEPAEVQATRAAKRPSGVRLASQANRRRAPYLS
jgi:hypothetical protein